MVDINKVWMKCKQIVNKCWDRCARLWDECCGVYYNKEESGKGKKECIGMGGIFDFWKNGLPYGWVFIFRGGVWNFGLNVGVKFRVEFIGKNKMKVNVIILAMLLLIY